ncbi:MAG: TatD family hydrolase [Dehalococcoidia bacterium]|nr:TatD family hydrolase [Dehalococcoidia bacterium]
MLTDCHTHLDQYAPAELPGILNRARQAGVGSIIVAGVTVDSSAEAVRLAEAHDLLWAGVGIHPTELKAPVSESDIEALRRLALSSRRVVCVSETGLDRMEGSPDWRMQMDAFRAQIALARELRLPLIVHTRDCYDETLALLRREHVEDVRAVQHYFQGDERAARACLDMGIALSLAKPLLRLPHLQEIVRWLPPESMVLETDSYPQPFKKKRENWTEPKDVRLVARKVAELRGVTLDEVERQTEANLSRILRRPAPGA